MKKLNPLEYLTGFLMGIFFGGIMESVLVIVHNLLCAWLGWRQLHIFWWMLIPVPLIFGLSMGRAIASLHLEDY